jgi:hypothetical protein
MHIVVETWTPNLRFLQSPSEARAEVLHGVRTGIQQMAAAGIVPLGWGSIEPSHDHPSGYDWFAVWQLPAAELVEIFLGGVAASGWYEWFDQINIVGELRNPDSVLDEHLRLERAVL